MSFEREIRFLMPSGKILEANIFRGYCVPREYPTLNSLEHLEQADALDDKFRGFDEISTTSGYSASQQLSTYLPSLLSYTRRQGTTGSEDRNEEDRQASACQDAVAIDRSTAIHVEREEENASTSQPQDSNDRML